MNAYKIYIIYITLPRCFDLQPLKIQNTECFANI